MKKIISFVMIISLMLSICACGSKALTLESLSNMYVNVSDDTRASFTFEDGTMTVEIIHYIKSASSPSGQIAGDREEYTKSYTLEGNNYVIVDGTKYYYEIDEEENTVEFSVKFMDLAKKFYIGYIK